VWVGVHHSPAHLVKTVKDLRRDGSVINHEVSMIRDIRDREFKIFTDAGRVCRPLFVVDIDESSPNKGNLVLTKEHIRKLEDDQSLPLRMDKGQQQEYGYYGFMGLIDDGVVEFVDAEEEETIMISMTPEELNESRQKKAGYTIVVDDNEDMNRRLKAPLKDSVHTWTHCEIHPSMILGICASIIPFPDHNQVSSSAIHQLSSSNIYSLLVILTNLLWVSKQWVFSSQILISAWTPCPIFSTIPRSRSPPLAPWSFLNSESFLLVKMLLLLLLVTPATTRKIPLL